jgi:hypothetical protein
VEERLGRTFFDGLGEEDRKRLRPLLLLEVTTLLDDSGAPGPKLKPNKKKRKDGLIQWIFCIPDYKFNFDLQSRATVLCLVFLCKHFWREIVDCLVVKT